MPKTKVAFNWAASCGGCEVAVLDINERILDVARDFEVLFWPVALDFKYKDVKTLKPGGIEVCFFNGAVRNSEQEEFARILRTRAKVMVAFGSCACFGGIPALANFFHREEILKRLYQDSPSTRNPEKTLPKTKTAVAEGKLTLPEFHETVRSLPDVVEVDYFLPGCPPPPDLIVKALRTIKSKKLPSRGTVLAGKTSLCDECPRDKGEKTITAVRRPHQATADRKKCLLEEGIICLGPATRSGCGSRCINANMPCRGCFGPTEEVSDQGAKMISSLASVFEGKTDEEIEKITGQIPDPAGTFYRFTAADSFLKRRV